MISQDHSKAQGHTTSAIMISREQPQLAIVSSFHLANYSGDSTMPEQGLRIVVALWLPAIDGRSPGW